MELTVFFQQGRHRTPMDHRDNTLYARDAQGNIFESVCIFGSEMIGFKKSAYTEKELLETETRFNGYGLENKRCAEYSVTL